VVVAIDVHGTQAIYNLGRTDVDAGPSKWRWQGAQYVAKAVEVATFE